MFIALGSKQALAMTIERGVVAKGRGVGAGAQLTGEFPFEHVRYSGILITLGLCFRMEVIAL